MGVANKVGVAMYVGGVMIVTSPQSVVEFRISKKYKKATFYMHSII